LEKTNEEIREELTGLASQTSSLRNEVQRLEVEMESLRSRNVYLACGLLVAFVMAGSVFAWKFAR
jgi:hypothetical protein